MSEEDIKIKALKIVMLGDTTVGKTSIINSYLNKDFTQDMLSNIGIDKNNKKIKMKDGNEIKLVIWDTAGQERFHSVATSTIKSAQGVIVSFDLTNEKSFKNLSRWLDDIKENNNKIPILLFGNKCDMLEERVVEEKDIDIFVSRNKLIYYETSAKDNINIEEGFTKIAEEAYEKVGISHGMSIKKGKKKEKEKSFC
jgi:small GTP-binding protein